MVLRPSLGIAFLCNCRQFSTLGPSGALPAPSWIPRGLRDGPGVTFEVQDGSFLSPNMVSKGSNQDPKAEVELPTRLAFNTLSPSCTLGLSRALAAP